MREISVKDKLLSKVKEKSLVRPKDFEGIKGARVHLSQLLKSGELVKLGRGLYASAENDFDERQSLLETARRVPKGVLCLLSALRFHELMTQNPFEIWLAIEGTSRKPQIETLQLNVFRFSGAAFVEGIETNEIKGVRLRIYNPAKTVADCFKYRNKIGLDVAIEALRDVWRLKKTTADKLWHYAKVCRMSNVMRPYLESIV